MQQTSKHNNPHPTTTTGAASCYYFVEWHKEPNLGCLGWCFVLFVCLLMFVCVVYLLFYRLTQRQPLKRSWFAPGCHGTKKSHGKDSQSAWTEPTLDVKKLYRPLIGLACTLLTVHLLQREQRQAYDAHPGKMAPLLRSVPARVR